MGATFCEIHNVTGGVRACKHISNYVWSRTKAMPVIEDSSGDHINFVTVMELPFANTILGAGTIYAYCDRCAKKYELPEGKLSKANFIRSYLRGFRHYKKETKFVCVDCLYKEVFGIEMGKTDGLPFLNTTRQVVSSQKPSAE